MLDTRQTNRRFYSEWYYCDKCGNQYPRQKMLVQNGVVVCLGEGTLNCYDKPGYQAAKDRTDSGYEQEPDSLPSISEDL